MAHTRSSPMDDATIVSVKALEYMATGRPIGYAGTGIAADLLARWACGDGRPERSRGHYQRSAAITGLIRDLEQRRVLGYVEGTVYSRIFTVAT